MGLRKVKSKSSIPTGMHAFMIWLANYLTKITGFITGPNAPDGFPYFSARGSNRFTTVVTPAITDLQALYTPVSLHGNHTPTQTKAFTDAKKLFLKNTLRPWNKENVLYNTVFTVTHRGEIGVLPVESNTRTAAGQTLEQIIVSMTPKGSCLYEIGCKTAKDATKHSSPDGKIPQFSYYIVDRVGVGQVQPAPPKGPEDCPSQGVDTRALFPYDFGVRNIGKIMYIFFRWYDIHHPEKSGPWTTVKIVDLA
ncbi:MAG: hypothetical protein ACYDCN_14255 [Bacteroidia bacterium]